MEGYFKEATSFMQNFLGEALKGNENIFMGVLVGITRLQGASIFGSLDNVDVCTMLNADYKDKFGFTENEVKELLKEYGMEDKEDKVKDYYNGYDFRGEVVYNPYSVVKYIQKGEFQNYWLWSSNNLLAKEKIKDLMVIKIDDNIGDELERLLQGGVMKVGVRNSLVIGEEMDKDDILNLLLHSSYLKYENYRIEGYKRYIY